MSKLAPKAFLIALTVLTLLGVGAVVSIRLAGNRTGLATDGSTIAVTASFYPVAEFARQAGGARATVTTLTPPGAEPHDFEPAPRDLITMQRAKVFIYNGAGLELWAERVLPDLRTAGVTVVKAASGITLLAPVPGAEEDPGRQASPYDPHVWLDPTLAKQQVANIKQGLAAADPAHRSTYEASAATYAARLDDLAQEYQGGLAHCLRREIVTSHAAFQYAAKRFDLTMLAISGLSPDEEPTPQKLAEIASFAKKHHVKYIFFETLVSSRLAETIAREVGAKTLVLNPIEGLTEEEISQGRDYLAVQRENLRNLRTALGCS